MSYGNGTLLWFRDNDTVWKSGAITETTENEYIVETEDSEVMRLSKKSEIHLRNKDEYTSEGLVVIDDLTQLTHLHEPAVLHSLQMRFDVDKIYTFTGPILIAVNPFKKIPGIYDSSTLESFVTPKVSSKPHVFATSNAAYRGVCDRQKKQTVLISGESGAGKTETTKIVMKFLAIAGGGLKEPTVSVSGRRTSHIEIENQVLESNPLLEAFGNAKTLRNDNSSRFGKFIELQFKSITDEKSAARLAKEGLAGGRARLCGARIQTYLLEKVRVTDQHEGERNFHIFYQCTAAAASNFNKEGKYKFPTLIDYDGESFEIDLKGFADHSSYAYLTKSSVSTLSGVNDAEEFENTIKAMKTIGMSVSDINCAMNTISTVLLLGNTKVIAGANDAATIQKDDGSFSMACELLGVTEDSLRNAICTKLIVTKTERYESPVNQGQAKDCIDALARHLYGMLFLRVVKGTNESIGYDEKVKLFCGVLDIFGFECFKVNSFEQLCINFTNERLQQFFNTFVFKLEEQLYAKEGIPWDPLDFPDNQDAVDLLQDSKFGLFAMLDEECMIPQGSDKQYCSKLWAKYYTEKHHKRFDVIKTRQDCFIINHFAGPVAYCIDSFMDKNKDQLNGEVFSCMEHSKNSYVSSLFKEFTRTFGTTQNSPDGPRKRAKQVTVSSEFRDQLTSLMNSVNETEPHFIRCIKPNPQNLPDLYDRQSVTEQLRSGGVLQAVQVSRAGYPIRLSHKDFWMDFMYLGNRKKVDRKSASEDNPEKIIESVHQLMIDVDARLKFPKTMNGKETWAVGKNLVFFKHNSFEKLQSARLGLREACATKIQAKFRARLARRRYFHILAAIIVAQGLIRGKLGRLRAAIRRREKSVGILQLLIKMMLNRFEFLRKLRAALKIQSARRGQLARKFCKKFIENLSAVKIQACWKGWVVCRLYVGMIAGALQAQKLWRMRSAKDQLRRLKKEAKEVGALLGKYQKSQEELYDLRKKNKELDASKMLLQQEQSTVTKRVTLLQEEVEKLHGVVEETKKQAIREKESLEKDFAEKLAAMSSSFSERRVSVAAGSPRSSSLSSTASPHAVVVTGAGNASSSALGTALVESHEELESSRKENNSLKEEINKMIMRLKEYEGKANMAESKYQMLLQSTAGSGGGSQQQHSVVSTPTGIFMPGGVPVPKRADIQLVGSTRTGKSEMLLSFLKETDTEQLKHFEDQKNNLIGFYTMNFDGKHCKIIDCNGDVKAARLIKEWYSKTTWVFVFYDLCDLNSYITAKDMLVDARAAGVNVMLVGNKFSASEGGSVKVDLREAKDFAAQNLALAIETRNLSEAIRLVQYDLADSHPSPVVTGASAAPISSPGQAPIASSSAVFAALDSFKTWLGAGRSSTQSLMASSSSSVSFVALGVLAPSLKGTRALKALHHREGDSMSGLRPVQEVQDSDSAITCIAFGQEKVHKGYVLLAVASKDATVVVYRCSRTDMEIGMLGKEFSSGGGAGSNSNNHGTGRGGASGDSATSIDVHCRLLGHTRAITSMFFNLLEDLIVTTSIDKSVRFWAVESGEMLKVFTDSSPVPAACFLPFNPSVFVAANSNAVLRLVNIQNGMVLQKLKVETEVRCLKFDDTGMFLLAGTKNGTVHVLEATDSNNLRFKFKVQLSRGGITCISFVPASQGQLPCLLVNSSDSSVTIVDCIYSSAGSVLNNLTVRHRVKVAHSLLPLKSCYSPSDGGYLISGSEDKSVYIYSLAKGSNYKMHFLSHHQVPVVAVAVNQQDTLLVSADSLGKIVFWRRFDFAANAS